jgi:hypothetical protein
MTMLPLHSEHFRRPLKGFSFVNERGNNPFGRWLLHLSAIEFNRICTAFHNSSETIANSGSMMRFH